MTKCIGSSECKASKISLHHPVVGLSSMLNWQSVGDGCLAGQIITESSAYTTAIKPVQGGWVVGIKGLPVDFHPFLLKYAIYNGNEYSHLIVPRANGINSVADLIREITQRLIAAERSHGDEK